jgi:transcriptional regulator with XRE-family HTH domain
MVEKIRLKIRAKKLGILLQDARNVSGKTLKECADAIGVSSHRISSFEKGENAPSLPELEGLAFFLSTPLDRFLGDGSLSTVEQHAELQIEKTISLRQRIVGAKLRVCRQKADLPMSAVADELEITNHMLRLYERGERPIPLPELEVMLQKLDLSVEELRDQAGPVGQWIDQQRAIEQFLDLPTELQSFVAKPINMPYLELAQRLSEMSVERLRSVAEGLLDITL